MEIKFIDHKDFAAALFKFLNVNDVFLVNVGCRNAHIEAISEGLEGDEKPFIQVEYRQMGEDVLADLMREFIDSSSTKGLVYTETQKGSDNSAYVVSLDENDYYDCTCGFHRSTNKICHHIFAMSVRVKEGTLHLKPSKVVKNISMVDFDVSYDLVTGVLTVPKSIPGYSYGIMAVHGKAVYAMMKYGLSVAEIKDLYDIDVTGYEFLKRFGFEKMDIKIRKRGT